MRTAMWHWFFWHELVHCRVTFGLRLLCKIRVQRLKLFISLFCPVFKVLCFSYTFLHRCEWGCHKSVTPLNHFLFFFWRQLFTTTEWSTYHVFNKKFLRTCLNTLLISSVFNSFTKRTVKSLVGQTQLEHAKPQNWVILFPATSLFTCSYKYGFSGSKINQRGKRLKF